MYKALFLILAFGCNSAETPTEAPAVEAPAAEAPAAEAPAAEANAAQGDSSANAEDGGDAMANAEEGHAGLAKADLADGTADKVVIKCVGCALSMDGDAAHIIEAHGYKMHMCSAACKAHYEKNLAGNLAQLTP